MEKTENEYRHEEKWRQTECISQRVAFAIRETIKAFRRAWTKEAGRQPHKCKANRHIDAEIESGNGHEQRTEHRSQSKS